MKLIKKILSLMYLILIFMFFVSICYKVKADNNTITKEYYFENLNDNFANNKMGTCGYVALEILLNYYDLFFNDDIIQEKYEIHSSSYSTSPGGYNDYLSTYNVNFTINEYLQYIQTIKNKSLHAKLIDIGINELNYSLNINYYQFIPLLVNYFQNVLNKDFYDYFTVYSINDESAVVENWIINQIGNGYIVLTGIADYQYGEHGQVIEGPGGSHTLIAYEYDSYDDCIYMNYGYHGDAINQSHCGMTVTNGIDHTVSYNTYNYGICLVPSNDIQHKHSNGYCFSHDYKTHIGYCVCGYNEIENHNFDVNDDLGCCKMCHDIEEVYFTPIMILDPTQNSLCGTYVNLFGGNLLGNDLITGFTRIIYFDSSSPSCSRLDYDFECSNDELLSITKYGTILAKKAGIVTIKASLKSDPRYIGFINININYPEYNNTIYYLNTNTDTLSDINDNGTEVSLLNQPRNLTSIHAGYSRVICFSQDNVYPSRLDFYWVSSNEDVAEVSTYGTVLAKEVQNETQVSITGYCKYNLNVRIVVNFIILPIEE